MPNSNEPIQRASSTCETSASAALPTRTRNTLPATSCASRLSPLSARIALTRAMQAAGGASGGASSTRGNATGFVCGGGRDASDDLAIAPD